MRREKVGKQARKQERDCFPGYLAVTLGTKIWNKSHSTENTMFTKKPHSLWGLVSARQMGGGGGGERRNHQRSV